MIHTQHYFMERFLQKRRFNTVKEYLHGDILDFGGNKGELKQFVKGKYTLCNQNYSVLKNKTFDKIISLAVLEHIEPEKVGKIMIMLRNHLKDDGFLIMTTPTPMSKPVLDLLTILHMLEHDNIKEHKKYWNKKDLYNLAKSSKFKVVKYKKFQLGFNQIIVLKKSKTSS